MSAAPRIAATEASPAPARKAPARPYLGEGSGPFPACVWGAGRILLRTVSVTAFRLRVRGQHNIPPAGGALLITNHQSFMDPWLIGVPLQRQIHYMARETLFKGGFGQTILELTNAFPVRRGKADLNAVRTAIDRLNRGFLVNLFPEATRSNDGTIGPIAAGLSIVLHRAKKPVIPVVIDGAYEAWPREARLPRPAPIRILYGAPIAYAHLADLSADDMAIRLRRELIHLQFAIGSAHAAASEMRLASDLAAGHKRLSGE